MSSYKDLMARALRAFPGMYSEPLDVAVAMLGSDGNYQWDKNGELRLAYDERDGLTMDFSDLDEDQAKLDEDAIDPIDCLRSLNASRQLELTAERQRRTLLDANMDTVVGGKCTESYFRKEYEYGSRIRDIVQAKTRLGTDTRFLYFPDNITPEWGEVLNDFYSWLEVRMNNEFGVSSSGTTTHWPEQALLLSQKINLARERLHPLVNDGESYEIYSKRINDLSSSIIDEILAEEKAEKAAAAAVSAPAVRRPRP